MSSVFRNSPDRTFIADSDLSAKQYYIVKLTTANHCDLAAGATDALIGVLLNAPKAADVADVLLRNAQGTGKVIAGGTVAIGDKLTSDSNGKAITTTTSGNQVIGTAIAAAVAGDIFEFMPGGTDRV